MKQKTDRVLSHPDEITLVSYEYNKIRRLLTEFFNPNEDKVDIWLQTKNLNLGNFTPMELITRGRAKKVLEFIEDAKEQGGW